MIIHCGITIIWYGITLLHNQNETIETMVFLYSISFLWPSFICSLILHAENMEPREETKLHVMNWLADWLFLTDLHGTLWLTVQHNYTHI